MSKQLSVWRNNTDIKHFPSLEYDIKTDVLIIGGGIAGILTAYELKQRGIDYILIEKNQILNGVSCNTTAKITSQHGLIYSKIVSIMGNEPAALYYKANQEAVEKYAALAQGIDCDFEHKDNYVYATDNDSKILKEADALEKAHIPFELVNTTELPIRIKAAVKFSDQAQFNPLKLLSKLSESLNIYENTFALKIKNNNVITNKATIRANKIIVATHFPFLNKHGSYPMKLYQSRSYVIALKNTQNLNGMYINENEKGLSFRCYGDYLLLGGGSHRTGKQGGGWTELRETAKRIYPEATEEFYWATQDCMSLDSIMYSGQYSAVTPDLYVSTGFNKWGMTSSMVSAGIVADLITDKKSEYRELFSPSRNMIKPQLAVNGFESIVNLLTPTTKRCSHLGCALKWNKSEHSWDCPCHGSRFSDDGTVLNNPAQKDI